MLSKVSRFIQTGSRTIWLILSHTYKMSSTLPSPTLPSTLPFAIPTIVISQANQWDAAEVFGVVFGLLAVILGIPGTVVAIHKLRKRRRTADNASIQGQELSDHEHHTALETEGNGLRRQSVSSDGIAHLNRDEILAFNDHLQGAGEASDSVKS